MHCLCYTLIFNTLYRLTQPSTSRKQTSRMHKLHCTTRAPVHQGLWTLDLHCSTSPKRAPPAQGSSVTAHADRWRTWLFGDRTRGSVTANAVRWSHRAVRLRHTYTAYPWITKYRKSKSTIVYPNLMWNTKRVLTLPGHRRMSIVIIQAENRKLVTGPPPPLFEIHSVAVSGLATLYQLFVYSSYCMRNRFAALVWVCILYTFIVLNSCILKTTVHALLMIFPLAHSCSPLLKTYAALVCWMLVVTCDL